MHLNRVSRSLSWVAVVMAVASTGTMVRAQLPGPPRSGAAGALAFVETALRIRQVRETSFIRPPRRFVVLDPAGRSPTGAVRNIAQNVTGDSVSSQHIDIADEHALTAPRQITLLRGDTVRAAVARRALLLRTSYEGPWFDALELDPVEPVFAGYPNPPEFALEGAHADLRWIKPPWTQEQGVLDPALDTIRRTQAPGAIPAKVEASVYRDGSKQLVLMAFAEPVSNQWMQHLYVLDDKRVIAEFHGDMVAVFESAAGRMYLLVERRERRGAALYALRAK